MPSAARTLVCPKCRTQWELTAAPAACPEDGSSLVSAKELAASEKDPMVGKTLENRYTILARLGSGSMGTVYRARQHAMGRDIAIKILRGDRADDETAKARFMREARANSLLASPNTVTVFDFGQSSTGEFFLAMELLEGESLGQRLTRLGRLPIPDAVEVTRQALRSLAEAHAKGIIHRDLKPDNLFFARVLTRGTEGHDETVKVLDFGIAKMSGKENLGEINVVETQAGTVFGTPRYMSPEQAQGQTLDARTDLYSLGVILYQMITGRPPFTDNDAVVVMARHIKSPPKAPSEICPEAGISRELEAVVLKMLAKDPTQRHPSAEVLSSELLAALESGGAITSGVRAALANPGSVRIPDSVRPPPPAAEGDRRSPALLVFLGLLVMLIVAASVFVGMRRLRGNPVPVATVLAAPPVVAVAAAAAPTEDPAPSVLPVVPAPPPTASADEPPPNGKRGHWKRPPKPAASAPARAGAKPAPAASTTSSYGVFE